MDLPIDEMIGQDTGVPETGPLARGRTSMISLKKYLDGDFPLAAVRSAEEENGVLQATLRAYGSAMLAMGDFSLDACPGLGSGLKQKLGELQASVSAHMGLKQLESTDRSLQDLVQEWGQRTARHYRGKAAEVKELLLVMARTAEQVGARDERCAGQVTEVTARLRQIATLEDLTEIRASIEKSAAELKISIERMSAEGKAAVEELRREIKAYKTKLEEAEELASHDALTGVCNRMCIENVVECRIAAGAEFCVAMVDLDGFKKVNDTNGHQVGDELLKQFAAELRSACRSTDVIGRWGGDEFVIVVDVAVAEATAQIERLQKWVCGDYTVHGATGTLKLRLDASIGLAEHLPQEPMKALMARADSAMYERKRTGKAA